MITDWESAATALRTELGEYGGLLNLFEAEQQAILQRDPDGVLTYQSQIEAQLATVRHTRRAREVAVESAVQSAGEDSSRTLRQLLPEFPPPVQPMFDALITEINRLIAQCRRRAQQNQALLARAIEVSEVLLRQLRPEAVTKTYSSRGRVKIGAATAGSRVVARG